MHHQIRDFVFSFEELAITSDQIEEVMGYLPGQSPEPFPEMIRAALAKGPEFSEVQGSVIISRNFSVDVNEGSFLFENSSFFADKKMVSQLSNSAGAVVFIGTAGSAIGEASQKLMADGELMEGYILDLLGSVIVGAAIEKIEKVLFQELKLNGFHLSNRYSPGYCGWPLTEQKKLFSLFPDNHCGIRLTDSCLMDPVKSVSGIIGFGSKVVKHLHECQLCDLQTCIYRNIRLSKQK
jgi:hypothetical protein